MSIVLIVIVSLLYAWAAALQVAGGHFAQALILIGYVIANIGLALTFE